MRVVGGGAETVEWDKLSKTREKISGFTAMQFDRGRAQRRRSPDSEVAGRGLRKAESQPKRK